MHRKKNTLLLTHVQENNQTYEYLGSDGIPIDDSYNTYLNMCSEFIAKAKKYKNDNLNVKNSLLHQTKYGYENSESFEEEILLTRREYMNHYDKIFNVTHFSDDPNCLYENSRGASKRIRIIREFNEGRPEEAFSENFSFGTKCWFTRYCTLAKFIQAARITIILNRLHKRLQILRSLTPEDIAKYELNEDNNGEEKEVAVTNPCVSCNYCPSEN
ncbi:hypothetical protein RUM43_008864 [Polyplax serrata]|uniref:Uncharacterized protein n=1 Tax=Polyplax serrata TaxID=468196 RepID=A0AAN8S891_POLSC